MRWWASDLEDISGRTTLVNDAAAAGDTARAVQHTSELILEVAGAELVQIAGSTELPATPLEAGTRALELLGRRAGSSVSIVERGDGYVDLAADPDPLYGLCVDLPADLVAERAGYPVLTAAVTQLDPTLTLQPHPVRGPGHYRLGLRGE